MKKIIKAALPLAPDPDPDPAADPPPDDELIDSGALDWLTAATSGARREDTAAAAGSAEIRLSAGEEPPTCVPPNPCSQTAAALTDVARGLAPARRIAVA